MTGAVMGSDEPLCGDLYDGLSARRYPVEVTFGEGGLALAGEDFADHVPWGTVLWIDSLPEAILLGRKDRPGWRLRLGHDLPAELLKRLPQPLQFGRWIDRFGLRKSLVCCAAVSGLIVFAAINTPSWLGRRIPISWETGMSDDGVEDLSANTCHTPASDAALAQLVSKLDIDEGSGDQPSVRVELIKFNYVNAVALPGGRVLVFDGLVKQIGSPDALAGVIGHEIGHVRERHVMQAMLREFGISMVLSGFRSGMTNTLGRMTALRYSREAETEADNWARARLAQASISPRPIANFFDNSSEIGSYASYAMAAYLSSHPDPTDRSKAFRASYRADLNYRPALDAEQFDAIRYACEKDVKAKRWLPNVR